MKYIKLNCTNRNCPVHCKCCFLPTEIDPTPEGIVHILFVGQGGGDKEREKIRPFIGPAGQRLRKIVETIRSKSSKPIGVAYSNTIRDNPDYNRIPTEDELKECLPFLYRDIAGLKKIGLKVVIPLGNAAKRALIKDSQSAMSRDHGFMYYEQNDICGDIFYIPTYHPSFLLRFGKTKNFDVKKLKKYDVEVIKDIAKAVKYAWDKPNNSKFE